MTLESAKGKTEEVQPAAKRAGTRATKGDKVWARDEVSRVVPGAIVVPQLAPKEVN